MLKSELVDARPSALTRSAATRPRRKAPRQADGLWLGRYREPMPIRARGAFHLYACRDQAGAPRVVVIPAPAANGAAARERIFELACTHALLDHPHIAASCEHGEHGGTAFAAFALEAADDFEGVVMRFADARVPKMPFAYAASLVVALLEALAHAHGVREPRTARPICFGAICAANVLIAADGTPVLIGFGHNPLVLREDGTAAGTPGVFLPPELAAGSPRSPGGDLFALFLLIHSFMPYVELPPALERVYRGQPTAEDVDLLETAHWPLRHVIAVPPERRTQDSAGALAVYRRHLALCGTVPDLSGFRRTLVALQRRSHPVQAEPVPDPRWGERTAARELLIEEQGAWYGFAGATRYVLEHRVPLRRVLTALVEKRLSAPGAPLRREDVLAAGWPGEDPIPEAAANRVHVALSTLRRMGLRGVLRRADDGWLLDPAVPVRWIARSTSESAG